MNTAFRLHALQLSAKLGLTATLLVLAGGLVASGAYLATHHENRDERPGLTLTDIEGHYHGVESEAPLRAALERGHPDTLAPASRDVLLTWLTSDRISEDYDNLDLGDEAPAEILALQCLSCHSRNSDDEVAAALPLEFWDDIKRTAFSSQIEPVGTEILLASTHTHALALGSLAAILILLAAFTRFSRIAGLCSLGAGLGLAVDLACWWIARDSAGLIPLLVAAGALFALCSALLILTSLAELWLPAPEGAPEFRAPRSSASRPAAT